MSSSPISTGKFPQKSKKQKQGMKRIHKPFSRFDDEVSFPAILISPPKENRSLQSSSNSSEESFEEEEKKVGLMATEISINSSSDDSQNNSPFLKADTSHIGFPPHIAIAEAKEANDCRNDIIFENNDDNQIGGINVCTPNSSSGMNSDDESSLPLKSSRIHDGNKESNLFQVEEKSIENIAGVLNNSELQDEVGELIHNSQSNEKSTFSPPKRPAFLRQSSKSKRSPSSSNRSIEKQSSIFYPVSIFRSKEDMEVHQSLRRKRLKRSSPSRDLIPEESMIYRKLKFIWNFLFSDSSLSSHEVEEKAPLNEFDFDEMMLKLDERGECNSEELRKKRPWFIVMPNKPWRRVWNLVLTIFILLTTFITPMTIAFDQYSSQLNLPGWIVLNVSIDIFFILDTSLNFFTAYYDEQKRLIDELNEIVRNYLKFWFWMDLSGSIPFDLLSLAIFDATSGKAISVFRILKLPRILRLLRITQFLRARQNIVLNEIIRMAKLLLVLFLSAHWVACFLFFVARLQAPNANTWAAVRGIIGYPDPSTGLLLPDAQLSLQYTTSIYFAFTILNTIGFGDIHAITGPDMICTSLVMVGGALMYAVVVGNVIIALQNLNAQSQRHTELILRVSHYMKSKKLPIRLQQKVIAFTEANWKRTKGQDENKLMAHLPPCLKVEIARHLYSEMIRTVSFLRECNTAFINALVVHLQSTLLLPRTLLCRKNEAGEHMYFLVHGAIELLESGQVYSVVNDGSYVGESALLYGVYHITARSATCCDLCVLMRRDFLQIVKSFPEFGDVILKQVQANDMRAKKRGKLSNLLSTGSPAVL